MKTPQTTPKISFFVQQRDGESMTQEKTFARAMEFIDVTRKEDAQISSKVASIIKVSPQGQQEVAVFTHPYFAQ